MRPLVIAVASVVLFFPLFWLLNAAVGPNWGAGLAAFAMYVAFPVLALKLWGASKGAPLPTMEAALAAGDLLAAEYAVSAAIEVEESEDEGKHFYLAIAPNKTLFLSGQYLYEPTERGVFPSTRIRLLSHRRLNFTYGVECLGDPLREVQRHPPFSRQRFEQESVPEDRQLFEGTPEEAFKSEV